MKVKPWPLVVLALFNVLAPLGTVLLSSHVERISVVTYLGVLFHHITVADLFFLLVVPWVSAYAIYSVKEWSLPVFAGMIAAQIGDLFYQWISFPQYVGLPLALGISALNLALGCYFLLPEVRTLYLERRLRWWEQKPRYEVSLDCRIQNSEKVELKAQIGNLSEGGVLLKLRSQDSLQQGEHLELRFSFENRLVFIEARVVYCGQDQHFGIQFLHNRQSMKVIRGIVHEIKHTGAPARGKVSLKDDFRVWAKNFFSSGKGWRPELPKTFAASSSAVAKESPHHPTDNDNQKIS